MGTGNLEHKPANAEQIMEEARRRMEQRTDPESSQKRDTAQRLNRGVYWLADHWVAFFNVVILLYLGGTILAPVMMHLGHTRIGAALYAFYRPFCHQYPFRSWFLFGTAAARPLHAPISILEMNRMRTFVGNAEVGYKIALCQRDVAIYGMMLVSGMIYGGARRLIKIPPLPLWLYFVLGVMPMMLDGGIQWLSYAVWQFFPGVLAQPFETIPTLRTLTGALFGLGVIAVGYPYLGEYFDDVLGTLKTKYGW